MQSRAQQKPFAPNKNNNQPKSKFRGHETFLLSPFFENLRFNITSIFKKEPVSISVLKEKYPKLYSTIEKVSVEYGVSIKMVLTSFLNLELEQKREQQA